MTKCNQCGKMFKPTSKRVQKYCSVECRIQFNNNAINKRKKDERAMVKKAKRNKSNKSDNHKSNEVDNDWLKYTTRY